MLGLSIPEYVTISIIALNRLAQEYCMTMFFFFFFFFFKPSSLAPWPKTLPQRHHAPHNGWIVIHSMFQLFSISRAGFDSVF